MALVFDALMHYTLLMLSSFQNRGQMSLAVGTMNTLTIGTRPGLLSK